MVLVFCQCHLLCLRIFCKRSKAVATNQNKRQPCHLAREKEWLDSKAARRILRVSTCELSHLREAGRIQFQKRGNAYIYSSRDANLISQSKNPRSRE